ncbi:hypothetical protein [Thermococcus sp.]|uniref:hypothetical protein n=1 Tax=Thermococcus sp. TaxID=35749 RepID=UPI00260B7F72|nr:hypothetical protein [Thermococcus sp.]
MQVVHESGSFDLAYEAIAPQVILGGVGNKTHYYIDFAIASYGSEEIVRALLDIVVSIKSNNARKWKIELSDVVLTREFKPQVCKRYSNGYVCKIVFDVTPIVKSKPSARYRVSIFYPEMNNEINLLHIGFLTLTSNKKAHTKYVYLNEPLILGPGEKTRIGLPFRLGDAYIKMTLTIPHSSAQLILASNHSKVEISGYQGSLEYTDNIKEVQALTIAHIGSGAYLPKEIIVSSLLIYETNIPRPNIDINIRKLNNSKAEIVVENNGNNVATNVVIVDIAVGTVVDRKVIEQIEAGEKKNIVIKMKPDHLNIIRAIWRFKDNTYIVEKKIRPS